MSERDSNSLFLEDVSIHLDGKELLRVDAQINQGEVLSVMGPSGSGKSSLLAFIAGFLDPAFIAKGQICFGNQILSDMPAAERRVGMLFQDPLLFPHMSVGQNLEFAISSHEASNKIIRRELVDEALEAAELQDYFERDPATLSGGQKSRVALMRVLLSRPRALLLDEPFSKLDSKLRDQIREFVFTEAVKRNLPTLMVTHDEEDVKAASGKVITLSN